MWAGLEKVNTHSGVDTHAQRMNISANCPLLTGQPAPYLSCLGWVTTGEVLTPYAKSRDQALMAQCREAVLKTFPLFCNNQQHR